MAEPDEPPEVAEGDPVAVAREIALRLLTVRQRTRAELAQAMARRKVPQEAAQQVLDRFTEVGLLNDAAFARDWVAAGGRRQRGRRVLAAELTGKGVAEELIEEALEQRSADDDLEAARDLARRRLPSLEGLDRQVRYRRLCGLLQRRGFGWAVIAQVSREVLDEMEDQPWVEGGS
ncbi:MAG: regulatory protein RecX [Propionibacteriaceae bacterium]|nr:regulatory protein RecX [Propionibacteriaceae bacterium]